MFYQCPTDGAQVWCDENYDYTSYTLPLGTFAPTIENASIITPACISTPSRNETTSVVSAGKENRSSAYNPRPSRLRLFGPL